MTNVGMELFYDPTKNVDVTEHVVLQMIGGLWCEGLFYDPGQSMIKIFCRQIIEPSSPPRGAFATRHQNSCPQ